MSEIIKTQGVVLRKINHGDTSKIITIFTIDYGKVTVIAKGVKSPKSKMNARLETFNFVELVYYNKQSREVQLLSSVDILKVFNSLTEDLTRYKYASAVIELILTLLPDHEKHERLFKGVIRILDLLNKSNENAKIIFLRFFVFFINEIGYKIELDFCQECNKKLSESGGVFYSYVEGLMCDDCSSDHLISFEFNKELFNLLICLSNKNNLVSFKENDLDFLITFFEKHLAYHISEFKGLKSLKLF